MRLLLQVKGVISITFDMNKKRCILRTKTEVRPEVRNKVVFRGSLVVLCHSFELKFHSWNILHVEAYLLKQRRKHIFKRQT